jgi:hypothetical protein
MGKMYFLAIFNSELIKGENDHTAVAAIQLFDLIYGTVARKSQGA